MEGTTTSQGVPGNHGNEGVCCICMDPYDLASHRPKLLPCSHTFCKLCLLQMGEEFECPVCRQHVSVLPGESLAFPTNFSLLDQVLTSGQGSGVRDQMLTSGHGGDAEETESVVTVIKADDAAEISVSNSICVICDGNTAVCCHGDTSSCHGDTASSGSHHGKESNCPNCVTSESQRSGSVSPDDKTDDCVSVQLFSGPQSNKTSDSNDITPTNSDDSEHTDEEKTSVSEEQVRYSDQEMSAGQSESQCFLNWSPDGATVSVDCRFDEAMGFISKKHSLLQTEMAILGKCKDDAISDIDRYFDKMVSVLNRRRHLLKTQVLDVFDEKSNDTEESMDQATLSLLCLEKLRLHTRGLGSGGTKAQQTTILSEINDLSASVKEKSSRQNIYSLSRTAIWRNSRAQSDESAK